jgi:hypothetical protein
MANVNGMPVLIRRGDTIFLRLPRDLWRSCGRCDCDSCKGTEGFWDTLAVAATAPADGSDHAWTVHYPEATAHRDRIAAGEAKRAAREARQQPRRRRRSE